MLCFLDRAFCGSDCANTSCSRHFGPEEDAAAKRWAKRSGFKDGAPVAFSDFSEGCNDYLKPGTIAPVLKLQRTS